MCALTTDPIWLTLAMSSLTQSIRSYSSRPSVLAQFSSHRANSGKFFLRGLNQPFKLSRHSRNSNLRSYAVRSEAGYSSEPMDPVVVDTIRKIHASGNKAVVYVTGGGVQVRLLASSIAF